MKTDIKNDTPRIVYTGERFKKYLQRNKISYKEAAELLGIDKNTVGKAVRGGNLNLDIILRICNVYPLRIADFFITAGEEGEMSDSDYYISLESNSRREGMVSEEEFCYKKCQRPFTFFIAPGYHLDLLVDLCGSLVWDCIFW